MEITVHEFDSPQDHIQTLSTHTVFQYTCGKVLKKRVDKHIPTELLEFMYSQLASRRKVVCCTIASLTKSDLFQHSPEPDDYSKGSALTSRSIGARIQ
jgi:hypothetical protein